jgi:hypothetical protein
MKTETTKAAAEAAEGALFLGDDWFDPLEAKPACEASFLAHRDHSGGLGCPGGSDVFQGGNLRQTVASQGCCSRSTPSGR